jgi:sortase (surface protein transpeptidase)
MTYDKSMKEEVQSFVMAGHYGWISTEQVDFLDIEETPYGDRMYFNYNGEQFQSKILQIKRVS